MFDIDLSLWIVILTFAIIVLRPKDWVNIMTKAGHYYAVINAYKKEWFEYMEFVSMKKKNLHKNSSSISYDLSTNLPCFVTNPPILFSRHEISVSIKN
ncbi:MAG: hypothetical protein C0432_05450 [Candidatus Puniceispirillum sp.]|nr:hypothetical protein [Candidatus Pelagibacter sp.]MBA4283719.1 hypothetical protein [Candidatus Puniceispirillum sp.]